MKTADVMLMEKGLESLCLRAKLRMYPLLFQIEFYLFAYCNNASFHKVYYIGNSGFVMSYITYIGTLVSGHEGIGSISKHVPTDIVFQHHIEHFTYLG